MENPFSMQKAKKVLGSAIPTLKGRVITGKQRKLLGVIAGGGKVMKKLTK